MREKRTRALRLVAVSLAAYGALPTYFSAASAEVISGNYWLEMCTRSAPSECIAYIQGLNAMHGFVTPRLYCAPDSVTCGQMQAVIIKYLRDNPAQLHSPFHILALTALGLAFPCQKNSR
jgi:hypothetical protein